MPDISTLFSGVTYRYNNRIRKYLWYSIIPMFFIILLIRSSMWSRDANGVGRNGVQLERLPVSITHNTPMPAPLTTLAVESTKSNNKHNNKDKHKDKTDKKKEKSDKNAKDKHQDKESKQKDDKEKDHKNKDEMTKKDKASKTKKPVNHIKYPSEEYKSEDNHKKHKHNDDEESNAKANESEQQNKHKHKNADEPNDDKADDKHKNKNKKEHNTDAPATTLPVNHIHYAPATEAKKHHKHDDADAAVVPDAPKTPPNDEIQQGTFFTIAPKPQDTPDDVDAVKNHAKNNQKQPTPHPTPAKHFHFDRHTRVVEEFPCDSVDTRVLDPTEWQFEQTHAGGACVWTAPKASLPVPIVQTPLSATEWRGIFHNDYWVEQCYGQAHVDDFTLAKRDVDNKHNDGKVQYDEGRYLKYRKTPQNNDEKPFETCAVVGNSYALRGQRKGEEIDAHDEVFRINWPPLGGSYADDVGAFTSHMITNRASLNCNQRIPDDEPPVCRDAFEDDLIELTNWRLCYKFLQLTYGDRAPPKGKVLLISPQWEGLLQTAMVKELLKGPLKGNLEDEAKLARSLKVSSGLLAVFTAVALCKQVDLYGFDGSGVFTHSYWERPRVAHTQATKSYQAERLIYNELHNDQLPMKLSHLPLGNVTLHTIDSDALATARFEEGEEGGRCLMNDVCHGHLKCILGSMCVDLTLDEFNEREQGHVSGAGNGEPDTYWIDHKPKHGLENRIERLHDLQESKQYELVRYGDLLLPVLREDDEETFRILHGVKDQKTLDEVQEAGAIAAKEAHKAAQAIDRKKKKKKKLQTIAKAKERANKLVKQLVEAGNFTLDELQHKKLSHNIGIIAKSTKQTKGGLTVVDEILHLDPDDPIYIQAAAAEMAAQMRIEAAEEKAVQKAEREKLVETLIEMMVKQKQQKAAEMAQKTLPTNNHGQTIHTTVGLATVHRGTAAPGQTLPPKTTQRPRPTPKPTLAHPTLSPEQEAFRQKIIAKQKQDKDNAAQKAKAMKQHQIEQGLDLGGLLKQHPNRPPQKIEPITRVTAPPTEQATVATPPAYTTFKPHAAHIQPLTHAPPPTEAHETSAVAPTPHLITAAQHTRPKNGFALVGDKLGGDDAATKAATAATVRTQLVAVATHAAPTAAPTNAPTDAPVTRVHHATPHQQQQPVDADALKHVAPHKLPSTHPHDNNAAATHALPPVSAASGVTRPPQTSADFNNLKIAAHTAPPLPGATN